MIEGIERVAEAEINEIMSKYDRESAYRTFPDFRAQAIAVVCVLFSIIQIWHAISSITYIRALHLALVMLLAFILYPAKRSMPKNTLPWYDVVLSLLGFAVCMYQVFNQGALASRLRLKPIEIYIGILGILLLLEATRRVVGLPIVIIAVVFIGLAVFGPSMPSFLKSNLSFRRIIEHLFYDYEGVVGPAIAASANFIFLFMLFGAVLERTGVGEFFIDLSNAIAGHKRGGPATVAVITSAMEGTVSGSSVANTVGSGSFTIPMMKSLGYRPEFAAAVEAAASTGGQIMPPVMGAAAFLMVDSVGVSYATIIKAAIIPALLYFAGIYIIIDLESKKRGLLGMDKDKMPRLARIMADRGYLILPLMAIIYVLTATSLTTAYAALIGMLVAVAGGYVKTIFDAVMAAARGRDVMEVVRKTEALRVKDYWKALETGARNVLSVALACATSGIVSGVITATGIGARIGGGLTALAGDRLLLLLFFTMITSIVLGMGVPTTANYLITSSVMAPVVIGAMHRVLPDTVANLAALGSNMQNLPAHLFTFYFGIVADITPPVALAAMAGAAIAKSDPLRTGVEATRLAVAAFLIPYMFIYNPKLLMLGAQWWEVLQMTATALIGMFGIAMCLERFYLRKMNLLQQLMSLAGGLMLIDPRLVTDLVGIALILIVVLWQRYDQKRMPVQPV
ncbi:MAG: TRAP transporter permease [Clostridiales bacterium]|nr:TRAP transporter permease [Clostridiales bacterium]